MPKIYGLSRTLLRVSILGAAFHLLFTMPVCAQLVFDHAAGTQTTEGLLEFRPGATVTFTVNNTMEECFDYNGVPTFPGTAPPSTLIREPVTWETHHQRRVTSYKVSVTKKSRNDKVCEKPEVNGIPLVNREWVVPVATLGWTVGVSAAFTIDKLTDRQFALTPATVNGTTGFTVDEDRDARDETTEGLAVFLHLSNTAWNQNHDIMWAPISLGIGFKDNTRYYLGTSAQFGEPFFLTAGWLFGKESRLPNGLAVGDFTTDANAISTLGTRTNGAWFLAFSYQFLSAGIDSKLKALFGGGAAPGPTPKQ